jgi:hypothetical protein
VDGAVDDFIEWIFTPGVAGSQHVQTHPAVIVVSQLPTFMTSAEEGRAARSQVSWMASSASTVEPSEAGHKPDTRLHASHCVVRGERTERLNDVISLVGLGGYRWGVDCSGRGGR